MIKTIIFTLFFGFSINCFAATEFIHAWYKSPTDIYVWITDSDGTTTEMSLKDSSELSKIDGIKDLYAAPANVDRIFIYYDSKGVNRISYHLIDGSEVITRRPADVTLLGKINTAKVTVEGKK